MSSTMKALALNAEGTAMDTVEIPKPSPAANEVLVKVQYSAIDTALDAIAAKDMTSGFIHDMKTKPIVLGYHFAGPVAEVGAQVKSFKLGDAVFGHLQYQPKQKQGAYSEFITVPETELALIPSKVTPEVAAASSTEAMTALQAMRDNGGLKEQDTILIIGAGGGVGIAAVGIAKALGANVTAICSTKDVARIEKRGADKVIDRSKEDVNELDEKFDVVFDVPNVYSFRQGRKWLKSGGAYVNTIPNLKQIAFGWFWPLVTNNRFSTVACQSKKEDLELVSGWMADGQLVIDVDSIHKASDFETAWKRHKDSGKTGRIVIQIQDGW